MSIKQIAVFIENTKGSLAEVTSFIAENGINLRALSIADTQEFGILRIITDNPEDAIERLRNAGFSAKTTLVLAVSIDDTPGSMAKVLKTLNDGDITVEYTYAFMSSAPSKAYMIFRVDDNDKATNALQSAGFDILNQSDLFNC